MGSKGRGAEDVRSVRNEAVMLQYCNEIVLVLEKSSS